MAAIDGRHPANGNPGSGKTTLALQFLLEGAHRGEKCLYVTLSETQQELEAGAASHGWSLDGIDVVELIPDQQHELSGDGAITMLQPSDVELSETMGKILDAIERSNPARVVFDSLSEMRLLAQSPCATGGRYWLLNSSSSAASARC
jgi:circadian clock protein KaiC